MSNSQKTVENVSSDQAKTILVTHYSETKVARLISLAFKYSLIVYAVLVLSSCVMSSVGADCVDAGTTIHGCYVLGIPFGTLYTSLGYLLVPFFMLTTLMTLIFHLVAKVAHALRVRKAKRQKLTNEDSHTI